MRIYLVQHGKAKPEEEDPKRPLSDEGRDEARKLAAHLATRGLKAKKIMHSGKARAKETAEIFGESLGVDSVVEAKNIAPLDDPQHALAYLEDGLMMVGHLPHLGKLAALLLGAEAVNFHYAGVLCLSKNERWAVEWYVTPEVL